MREAACGAAAATRACAPACARAPARAPSPYCPSILHPLAPSLKSVPPGRCAAHLRFKQGGAFRARGSLTYTGPKLVTTKSRRLVSVQIEQSKLSSDDIAQMQKLIDGNENYRIRIQVPPTHPGAHDVAAECAQAQTKRSLCENVLRVRASAPAHASSGPRGGSRT